MGGEKLQQVIDEIVKAYPGRFMVICTRLVEWRSEVMVYVPFSCAAPRPERMAFSSFA